MYKILASTRLYIYMCVCVMPDLQLVLCFVSVEFPNLSRDCKRLFVLLSFIRLGFHLFIQLVFLPPSSLFFGVSVYQHRCRAINDGDANAARLNQILKWLRHRERENVEDCIVGTDDGKDKSVLVTKRNHTNPLYPIFAKEGDGRNGEGQIACVGRVSGFHLSNGSYYTVVNVQT